MIPSPISASEALTIGPPQRRGGVVTLSLEPSQMRMPFEAKGCSPPTVKRRDGPLLQASPPITVMANPWTCDETDDWYVPLNRLIDSQFVSATTIISVLGEYLGGRKGLWWSHPALCPLLCPTTE